MASESLKSETEVARFRHIQIGNPLRILQGLATREVPTGVAPEPSDRLQYTFKNLDLCVVGWTV